MKDLTVGKESSLILQFAWPMLIGNVFQQLYNIVDSIIVGHYLGKEALAAVGASAPIIFAMVSLVIGFSMGFTIIISQFFGAKKMDMVRRTIDTLNIFLFFSSIIISALGVYYSEELLRLVNIPEDIIAPATIYLRIYLSGLIFFFGYNSTAAILRGVGDSKTPLYFLIISTVLNIILVLLFVVVFDWGIAGASVATLISQAVAYISSVFYLNIYYKAICIKIKNLVFDWKILKKSISIGLPTGLQITFVSIGMMALMSIVGEYGTDVIAAYSVAIRIDSFASLAAMNFSAALASFVGQNIGAEKHERVKNGYRATLKMNAVVTIVISAIILIFPGWLMNAFTPDHIVIDIGKEYLYIVGSFYIIFSSMFVVNGVMRGAGDTLIPMFITLISLWLIRIPLAWYLSHHFSYQGIWWSVPIAWTVAMILSYSYYKTGRWKNKAVTKSFAINSIE